MDKTIENKLFDEFRTNGAASMCLEYFKEKEIWKDTPPKYLAYNDTEKVLSRIKERTEAFDETAWPMGLGDSFPLAEEITANLDSSTTDKQRENYIIDILEIYKDWAAIFSPIAEINKMKQAIELSQNDDEFGLLERYKDSLDYLEGLHDHYLEIMDKPKEGTMEYYLNFWYRCYNMFCRMLAAILAKNGINLLEIQHKRGIWLVDKLESTSIQLFFGLTNNTNYANHLLEELDAPNTQHLILTERNNIISNWLSKQYQTPIEPVTQCDALYKIRATETSNQGEIAPKRKTKRSGRHTAPFEANIIGDDAKKESLMELLRKLINGRKGREVALIIIACIERGLLHKPTYSQVKGAFGEIGDKSGYNRYVNYPGKFSNVEKEGMRRNFDSI